jgi:hypothetical protein
MLLEQETREVSSQGLMQTAKATIKATPKIFNFFADQTYANKPVAIARELVANAIDAHTAAGRADVPVEVWLPNELDPVFRVRDRGIGMSHEFMMTRFMAYTDGSTKDQSNDQIGGFGIGSKSPFAYTDQFTIRCTHDGVVSVYTIFKDEDGVPAIGLLAQGATEEDNGVEVSFPVAAGDFEVFASAAQTALPYFNPLPIVHNGELTPPDYIAIGKGWAMRKEAGALGVIMGGVRYPVDFYSLEYGLRQDDRLKYLLDYGLDINLPIGACGVALSREALSYDDRTSASIRAALDAMLDEIVASFATMFDHCETWWEARAALHKEIGDSYNSGGRTGLLRKSAYWRGQKLDVDFAVQFPMGTTHWHVYANGSRSAKKSRKNAKWEGWYGSFKQATFQSIIIDDLPLTPKSKTIQRIKAYLEETWLKKDILVLRQYDHTNVQAFLDALGNPPREAYLLTSELEVPEIARPARRGDRPKVRLFRHGGLGLGTGYDQTNRVNPDVYSNYAVEVPYTDQPDTGILVTLTNFELPSDFFQKMDTGLITYDELHFANQGDAAKLKGWTSFDDEFNRRLKDALSLYAELPQRLALYGSDLSQLFSFIASNKHRFSLTPTQHKSPFGRIVAIYDRYIAPLSPEQRKLARFVTPTLPKRVDPAALLDAFKTKQASAVRLLELTKHSLSNDTDARIFVEIL